MPEYEVSGVRMVRERYRVILDAPSKSAARALAREVAASYAATDFREVIDFNAEIEEVVWAGAGRAVIA